jgi:glycine cleavage system H lipoate-binding protein
MVALIFAAFVIAVIATDQTIQYMKKKRRVQVTAPQLLDVFDERAINIPKGLYFDKTHTWAFMDRSGKVEVGINDFLQNITGKPSRIEMKKPGEKVRKGEHLLTIVQQGKRLNIYSPVSGIVQTVNENLNDKPSLLNTAPYTEGWVYRIEPANWLRETQFMLIADQTADWMKKEFVRLKDFLTTTYGQTQLAPIMQDGGSIKGNILEGADPGVWEDFQNRFIDSIK